MINWLLILLLQFTPQVANDQMYNHSFNSRNEIIVSTPSPSPKGNTALNTSTPSLHNDKITTPAASTNTDTSVFVTPTAPSSPQSASNILPVNTPTTSPATSPGISPTNVAPTPSTTPNPSISPTLSPTISPEDLEMNYIEELKKLGYIKNDVSETDINNRWGILRFQADSNLEVDGIFGPRSTAALTKRLKDKAIKYHDTVSKAPTSGYWIFINKTKKSLTLYKGNEVVKKYPLAVGNPPSLTPEGNFKIVIKLVNPAWYGGGYSEPIDGGLPQNPLGYRWMGLDIGGGGSYGIHGTNAPYSIGTYASHGCIRMPNPDVESLFEIVPVDTPVWIGNDDNLKDYGITQTESREDIN